jgi:pyruvate/2-oxoacid:ferredoxin oxidoreductase alpha subunit
VAAEARADGIKVACCGPSRFIPFPKLHFSGWPRRAKVFVVVEMSNGQMVEDVRLALNGARPVEFLSRVGGNVPSHEEVLGLCANWRGVTCPQSKPEEERMAHV